MTEPQEPQQPQQPQQQPQQPQWSPPPQQQPGWGGGGVAPVERPIGVTLAAIYLIVMGVLVGLVGACAGVVGGGAAGLESQIPGISVFGGAIAIFGMIVLVLGIFKIVAGAAVLSGKGWARWIGIVLAVIFGLLFGLFGLSALGQDIGSAVFFIVIAVLYAASAYALIAANAYFAARR